MAVLKLVKAINLDCPFCQMLVARRWRFSGITVAMAIFFKKVAADKSPVRSHQ